MENSQSSHSILVVAAHPDDEVLGCGGTIARLAALGAQIHILILGEGKTARGEGPEEQAALRQEIQKAHQILGVKKTHLRDFPDNAFDSIPLLDIVKTIEEIKKETRPYMIFTHSDTDLNIDHQLTHKAVLTATRPQPQETVTEIYAFEVLSSTEWNFPVTFSPDTFIDITQTLPKKLDAMAAYASELRDYPHPRSLEGIRTQAKHRGLQVALSAAEAFKTIRKVQ